VKAEVKGTSSMSETILLARKGELTLVPRQVWEGRLAHVPEHGKHRLNFMSKEHHLVRYFVVREMPHLGKPIEAGVIAQALALPLERVEAILEELERNLFFLVRDERGAVVWAYPITVEETPHRLSFSTGEKLYAA
jgi:hypothetical protein